jgi:hypothetical protein
LVAAPRRYVKTATGAKVSAPAAGGVTVHRPFFDPATGTQAVTLVQAARSRELGRYGSKRVGVARGANAVNADAERGLSNGAADPSAELPKYRRHAPVTALRGLPRRSARRARARDLARAAWRSRVVRPGGCARALSSGLRRGLGQRQIWDRGR